jgi:hypothetical protein
LINKNCETRAGLWVPETPRTSCCLLICVEEAAEAVVSLDLADVGRRGVGEWPCGSCLPERSVWTVIVVMACELAQPGRVGCQNSRQVR